MRGLQGLKVFEQAALVEFIHMANESHRTKEAVQIIMIIFGMWGQHHFAPLTESVKKWASHQEQQDVINSIQEVLGEDPPKRPFVKRLIKSLSFAVMFIDRARSVLEPDNQIRSAVRWLFSSYYHNIESREENDPIRQLLKYIRDSPDSMDSVREYLEHMIWENTKDSPTHSNLQTSGADDQISPTSIPATVEKPTTTATVEIQTTTKVTHAKTRSLPHHMIYHWNCLVKALIKIE